MLMDFWFNVRKETLIMAGPRTRAEHQDANLLFRALGVNSINL